MIDPALPRGRSGVRFARRMHPPRTIGMFLCAICIGATLYVHDAPPFAWVMLVWTGLIWSHVALWLALRSPVPYQGERRNLMIDSALAGFWLPLMAFNPLPSAILLTMANIDAISVGGVRFMLKGAVATVAGIGLGLLAAGLQFQPEIAPLALYGCLPVLMIYPLLIGHIAYNLALQLAAQKAELQRLTRTDSLSGLSNRRHWNEAIEHAFDWHRQRGTPASLILLDIDDFKAINDSLGHDAGDAVICHLAELLRTRLRTQDVVEVIARYGGEEFGLLLPETDEAAARQVAERLRRQVAEAVDQPHGWRYTISLGVSGLHSGMRDSAAWLKRTDQALYAAKQQGRDRTVCGTELAQA